MESYFKAKGDKIERQTKEGSKRREQTCKSFQAISAQSQERETLKLKLIKIKTSNSNARPMYLISRSRLIQF